MEKLTQKEIDGSEVSERVYYNGNKMIIIQLSPYDNFPFQFGQRKAQLIVKHIDQIKAFAEKGSLKNDL